MARASWIDPDTLPEYRTKDFEGDDRQFDLVFSDEFDRYAYDPRSEVLLIKLL